MTKCIAGFLLLLILCFSIVGQTITGITGTGIRLGNDPYAISGLNGWWNGSSTRIVDTSAPSNTVSSLSDLSGNGFTASRSTKANQPSLLTGNLNGYDVFGFDGGDALSVVGAITNAASGNDVPFSWFCVVNQAATATDVAMSWGNNIGASSATNSIIQMRPAVAVPVFRTVRVDDVNVTVNATQNASSLNVWQVLGYSFAGTTGRMRLVSTTTNLTTLVSQNTGVVTVNSFTLGGFQRNGGLFANQENGMIAEWIVYNRALSVDEEDLVVRYLVYKYALNPPGF